MSLTKLEKDKEGKYFLCPKCGHKLHFVEGGAVRVVDGQVDMANTKPKYECGACHLYYREVMDTGYFDVFAMTPDTYPDVAEKRTVDVSTMRKIANEYCTNLNPAYILNLSCNRRIMSA